MVAFLVVAGLFVATVLLWLSMRRHLGRIDIDDPRDESAGDDAEGDTGEDTAG